MRTSASLDDDSAKGVHRQEGANSTNLQKCNDLEQIRFFIATQKFLPARQCNVNPKGLAFSFLVIFHQLRKSYATKVVSKKFSRTKVGFQILRHKLWAKALSVKRQFWVFGTDLMEDDTKNEGGKDNEG